MDLIINKNKIMDGHINGEKPNKANLTTLAKCLSLYTLCPTFEDYGDFIIKNPLRLKFSPPNKFGERYTYKDDKGEYVTDGRLYPDEEVTQFFGNFVDYSLAFSFATNDDVLTNYFTKLIKENTTSDKYARSRILTNKNIEGFYAN
jgi:hypothetical protein